MITVYTHYSNSHKEMYENFFKASLRKLYTQEEVKIKGVYHTQTTLTGSFMTPGWNDAMDIKLGIIQEALETDERFIFADCDIQFFKPFVSDIISQLSNVDMVCQEDRGSLCAGFFGCNSNARTKDLFLKIRNNFRNMVNDQVALNYFKDSVNYKLLDAEQYYTIGNTFVNQDGTFIWDNQTKITPPTNIKLHHANYVVGPENKIKLLEMIKQNESLVQKR